VCKNKGKKNGKAKIPPPDPHLFGFPPKRAAFFGAVGFENCSIRGVMHM